MLVVKLELWPWGNKAAKHKLGTVRIVNDGTGNESVGNYNVTLFNGSHARGPARVGKVLNFRRQRGAWMLLLLALAAVLAPAKKQRTVAHRGSIT